MTIVTVSKQPYSRGKEVAERVAEKLGFECISGEILSEASDEFHVPELNLLRGVRDGPSLLDRFTFGKEKYSAYFQAALLERLQKDNVVYYGLAGHYFVRQVSHALKVRVIGEIEDRVELVLQRERLFEQAATSMSGMPELFPEGLAKPPMTRDDALRVLEHSDEARKKWGLHLYGIDTHDSSLYDMVVHLNKLTVEEAAEVIRFTARLDRFQTTAESRQAIEDLAIAARVRAQLIESYPRVQVVAKQGAVRIGLEGGTAGDEQEIREIARRIPEIKQIEVTLRPFMTPD